MMMMEMMQAFPRPPTPAVVASRCCCKLEIADHTLPSMDYLNQGRGVTSPVDFCNLPQGGQNFVSRVRREARMGSLRVCSDLIDRIKLMVEDTTTTTTAGRSSGMDCHDHQEERESTSSLFRSSILDCNSSSAAADVLFNDVNGPRGNDVNVGTTNVITRYQSSNSTSSVSVPLDIECFNEADISAAWLLLEMSCTTSHSGEDGTAEEDRSQEPQCSEEDCSQEQQRSIIRVSDFHADAAPPLPPVRELSELVGATTSSYLARAGDDEVGAAVQDTKANWDGETTYSSSSTPRSHRTELRTLGKKRIKPRKDERELVFGMNQEVLTSDNILDRPTKKRHYKSLRELLGGK